VSDAREQPCSDDASACVTGPVLATLRDVSPPLLLALGAGIGALLVRQRRDQRRSNRLAAAALETLLNAIDANDAETGAHVRRVAAYSIALARAADLDEPTVRSIERVALFHDIGKIHEALFDIVHDGDADVTDDEWRLIATHPRRGAEVLQPLSFFYPDLEEGVMAHHERWDGSGYPRGLAGEAIPLPARVVAICDTFDAVTYRRRYRDALGIDEGVRAIAEGAGTQFDAGLVRVFLGPDMRACIDRLVGQRQPRGKARDAERRHAEEGKAPDIPFRWRDTPPAPPS
jgi:HD-GYP domain-containing protein (c-di-GMP phosphodiesterase class II)